MKVLVVNGFAAGEANHAVINGLVAALDAKGHEILVSELAAEHFDRCMSPDERRAYGSGNPLIHPETIGAAEKVRSADAIIIAYPLLYGTAPHRVKSWYERVFVEGVSFAFNRRGAVYGLLSRYRRALVIGVAPEGDDEWDAADLGYHSYGRSLARSFALNSRFRCRSKYVRLNWSERRHAGVLIDKWT